MVEKDEHVCPCCNKYKFEERNSFDICDVCDWQDDAVQEEDPDFKGGANKMSLNEAKIAHQKGIQVR